METQTSPVVMKDIMDLITLLLRSWSAETSATPDLWTPERPETGQCAVTALVVQDRFGGDLLRCRIDGESHYYNRLPSGGEVDLTASQFGAYKERTPGTHRTRGYVLSYPDTQRRYTLLKDRIKDAERVVAAELGQSQEAQS